MGFRVEALRASRVLGLSIGLERSKFRDYIGFRALGMHDTRGVPAKLCASHPGVGGAVPGPYLAALVVVALAAPAWPRRCRCPSHGHTGIQADVPAMGPLVSRLAWVLVLCVVFVLFIYFLVFVSCS